MTATITVPTRLYEDHDDCLTAAAEDYIAAHPEAAGYDLSPRWDGGDDGEREAILLDVPVTARITVETPDWWDVSGPNDGTWDGPLTWASVHVVRRSVAQAAQAYGLTARPFDVRVRWDGTWTLPSYGE